MSTEVRLRRGTTAQHAAFTGALAEVTVNTDKKALHVHDGSTTGGNRTLMLSELGAASGVADLDSSGNIPTSRLGSVAAIAATRTALKALDTTKITAAYLRESGREGQFLWLAGDYSTQVAADTNEGIYVKATAIAATAGAWVRVYQGNINVKWFGAVGKNGASDSVGIQAAVDMCGLLGGGNVFIPAGTYNIATTITVSKNFTNIIGEGVLATIISPTVANMDAFQFYTGTTAEIKECSISEITIFPSSVTMGRAIIVRNHYNFNARKVTIWGANVTGIEFENGAVAYSGILRDVFVNNSTSSGLLLGANGTGDLQNILLYNCHFDGGNVGTGVTVRNCGGLIWEGGEVLNKDVCMRLSPDVSGRRVNGVRISGVFFDTPVNIGLWATVATGTRVGDCIFVNCHFNSSTNDSGVVLGGLSSDATLINSITFSACNFIINRKYGLFATYAQKITINACKFISNGQDGISDNIGLSTGVSFVNIIGGLSGAGYSFSAAARYGVSIVSGVTNVVIECVMLTGNVTGPVSDSGTGTIISKCPGCVTFAKGAGSFPTSGTTFSVNHGLAFTPAKEDVIINSVSSKGTVEVWTSAVTATQFTISSGAAIPAGWFFGWQVGVKGN